jgi:UDP-N-acetylglucosamine 3-dehydrogenase
MEKIITVGVIGLGQMGTIHARNYHKLPGVKLAAICEANDEKREIAQKEFQCKAYHDYEDLLADNHIDAVSIVLPDNMHRKCVESAIAHHKHILLEKPLAKELVDGKAMYSLLENYDKVFSVGFLLRYDPRFAMLKTQLDSGRLGDIMYMYCRRNSPIIGPRRYIGASDLSMHVMIHDIDYCNWYMQGAPVSVFAKARSVLLKEHQMNDVICAILTYPNGAIVCLEACWVLPEKSPTIIDDKVEVIGTKGAAYIDSCDNGIRFVSNDQISFPDSRHWYEVNGQPAGDLSEEILAFITNIANGTNSIITAREALDSLRVVDAIERSLQQNKEVVLDA